MNKAEQLALSWLKQRHPGQSIVFFTNSSPAFIVDTKIGYEVKRGYPDRVGNIHIVGTKKQLEQIRGRTELESAYVLVVYDSQLEMVELNDILSHRVPHGKIIPHWQQPGMSRIDVILPDDLEKRFRMEAGKRLGAKRSAFTMAIIEAIELWLGEGDK